MDPQQFWQNQDVAASSPDVATDQPMPQGIEADVPVSAEEPETVQESTTVDYEARARELEAETQRIAAEAEQYKNTLSQVGQWAQQYQMQQEQAAEQERYRRWESEALEQARNMSRDDAERYMQAEYRKMQSERDRMYAQQMQQLNQQREMERRSLGKPLFIDRLVKDYGLSEEDRLTLVALDNPDDAARLAPSLQKQKQRYDALQKQINQLSRTQQAAQLQQTGIGNVGGVTPPGVPADLPTDPDERAIALLRAVS